MMSMSSSPSNAGGEDRNRPSRGEEPTLLSVPDTPRSVLLVGQDPRMNQSLSTLMTEEGYGVRIACHALEAIQTAEAEPFGAVVLTCALPGQDAATLSKHLTHVAPDLPVIVCAGPAAGVEESAADAQGVFALLHRPDDRHDVRATLRSAMLLHTLTRKVRKLELSLYQSQERLHAVVEAAPDAIVLADQDGRILSWNKAAEAMFCYTVEEALGQPLTIMMPERYREAHEEGLRRVRASGRSTVIGRTWKM